MNRAYPRPMAGKQDEVEPRLQGSDQVYAIPFGRYEGTRPNEYPADAVLVGRARERARMMDWLLTMGSRGAYLVTGYRGTGKTQFVQFCVDMYEQNVYGRYLQCKTGRAIFWDRVIAALVIPFLLTTALVASQVASGAWHSPAAPTDSRLVFLLLLGTTALSVGLLPFFYAFTLALRCIAKMRMRWWTIPALLVVPPLVGFTCTGAEATGFCVAVIGAVYSATHLLSVEARTDEKGTLSRCPGSAILETDPEVLSTSARKPVLTVLALIGLQLTYLVVVEHAPASTLWLTGVLSFATGAFFYSRDLAQLAAHESGSPQLADAAKENEDASLAYCVVSIVAFCVAAGLLWLARNELNIVLMGGMAGTVLLPLAVCPWIRRRTVDTGKDAVPTTWFHFHPRPRLLLACKACFSAIFGYLLVAQMATAPMANRDESLARSLFAPLLSLFDELARRAPMLTRRPFHDLRSELEWFLLSMLLSLFLLHLEHDWIIRRHDRARHDDAYDPARGPSPEKQSMPLAAYLNVNRELAKATTFWGLFETWLPTLTVRVNLGFDDLSHVHVVTAMLLGLRNAYYRTFISVRSRIGFLSRVVLSVTIATFGYAFGAHLARHEMQPDWLDTTVGFIPFDAPIGGVGQHPILEYHLLGIALVALAARFAGAVAGVSRHRKTYAQINDILNSLSSTVRVTRSSGKGGLEWSGAKVETPTSTHQVDTGPRDPRMVEETFLELLRRIQEPHVLLPLAGHVISLPAPQITFIFDELDKIGLRSKPSGGGPEPLATDKVERERSRKMHGLFADMKNLLCSAPARFIFVGGRELHDEWLADRTSRQPLLSNVFDGEIYLSTLLADPVIEEWEPRETDVPSLLGEQGIAAYLNAQFDHVRMVYERWQGQRKWARGALDLSRSEPAHAYVQRPAMNAPAARKKGARGATPGDRAGGHEGVLATPRGVFDMFPAKAKGGRAQTQVAWADQFMSLFVLYLGFRSRGNPKRLHGLLEQFVRPVGRVVVEPTLRWTHFDCQHVLRFGQAERFTIELVGAVYRRLSGLLGKRTENRDDKLIRSALYLADYLLKFHRRAFSWTSLERIDELLHVHRAPDLRQVLEEMVRQWTPFYLHPVLEGMYDFRFRSEVAAEVRYISRHSEAEMAAFNFTLDEAQELKTEYQTRLDRLRRDGDASFEVKGALGELHDFDQDYEEARRYYRAAIDELDAVATKTLSKEEKHGVITQMLDETGAHPLRRSVEWGVARIRLMLQIGMTYERSRNYEAALVQYRDARTVARAVWFAMIDDYGRNGAGEPWAVAGHHRLDTLKKLPLLYQPLFAFAWVSEKAPSSIDSGLSIVEQALWDLRCRLPFVRHADHRAATDPVHVSHANFALTMANLHHNAGNLFFFKGCQTQEVVDGQRAGEPGAGDQLRCDGYLLQAQYHHACSIHDLKDFGAYRIASARAKLDPTLPAVAAARGGRANSSGAGKGPLPIDVVPEFMLRRGTSALLALADVWLARVSLRALIDEKYVAHPARDKNWALDEHIEPFFNGVPMHDEYEEEALFGRSSDAEREKPEGRSPRAQGASEAAPWRRNAAGHRAQQKNTRLLAFKPEPARTEALKIARYVRLARWGASLLERGGHHEEAGQERIWTAAVMETMAWSLCLLNRDEMKNSSNYPVLDFLVREANFALAEAKKLLDKAQPTRGAALLPVHARRIALSLALLAERKELMVRGTVQETLKHLLSSDAAGAGGPPRSSSAAQCREALEEILEQRAYSMLNRLMTLRLLLLDDALFDVAKAEESTKLRASRLRLRDLMRLESEYASPMHFTPFHLGTAILAIVVRDPEGDNGALAAAGRRALRRSQQMYTARSAYYESLSNLYYLDDDFNDRCLHVHHAVQMMGADLVRELLAFKLTNTDDDVELPSRASVPPMNPLAARPADLSKSGKFLKPDAGEATPAGRKNVTDG